MSAVVMPDEEELYLLAILDAPDGLDLAEFTWYDPESSDGCYRAWDFQWCLRGDALMYTDGGRRRIDECVGPVRLLSGGEGDRGAWVDAQVRSYGLAQIWRVDLERQGITRSIWCTAEHAWFAGAGRADRRTYEPRATRELAIGDRLAPMAAPKVPVSFDRRWVQAGIVMGDGTVYGPFENRHSKVALYGDKQYLASWFDRPAVKHVNGNTDVPALRVAGLPSDLKHDLPTPGVDKPSALWGWLAGYFATDGSVLPDGTCVITSVSSRQMLRLRDVATALGVRCSAIGHREVEGVLPGGKTHRSIELRVVLNPSDLEDAFFLRPEHLLRHLVNGRTQERATAAWTVVGIEETDEVSEVFCAEVPDTHAFVLDGDILTGNSWYTNNDMQQVDQGGRALGKSVGIKMRAGAFPFAYEGQSMLLTAPELNHLRPLTDMVEKALLTTRLLREMLPDGKGKGIARQPHWQVRFKNGTSLVSRLPNKDGKGVKGQHVINIELDEAQDYPLPGWIEIVETLNAGLPGAMWRCHGVSKGVRDKFFEKTQPDSGWTIHRPMAMHRPTWGDEERQKKIKEYGGSRQSIDYRRNIYGEHGDASNSVFVLARLMACVDLDEGSTYNGDVYTKIMMEFENFPAGSSDDERLALMHSWMDFPGSHRHGYSQKVGAREVGSPKGYSAYWGGMDVGVTNHPSEILIYGQRTGTDLLELLTRIQMHRINTDDQKHVVAALFEYYGDKLRFGIDKTGVGFPIWDQLTRTPYGARVFGFGFAEKRVVAIEDRELVGTETLKDLARYRNFVEASTDWLRNDYVDTKLMRLPYDREILIEFQGQTYTVIRDNGDPYGSRRLFSGGSFHTLDAAKIAVATKHIPPLEELLESRPLQNSVLDMFAAM